MVKVETEILKPHILIHFLEELQLFYFLQLLSLNLILFELCLLISQQPPQTLPFLHAIVTLFTLAINLFL